MKPEAAISEVLGAVLMIAIIVTAFGILGVTYLSQPPPEKIPQVTFELKKGSDNLLQIIHNGGDPLRTYNPSGQDAAGSAEFYFLVDNEKWPIKNAQLPMENGKQEFAFRETWDSSDPDRSVLNPGEGFLVQPVSLPKKLDVIYKSPSGSERILWSALIPQNIEFSIDKTSLSYNGKHRACINDPVVFNDTSVGTIVYSDWDVDYNINPGIDGIGPNITHAYDKTGLYTVVHTIRTDEGLNFTLKKDNLVDVKPVHADFSESWDPDACEAGDNACSLCKQDYPGRPCGREPLIVDFIDTSICNPTGWNWDFGDNRTSTDQNPSHDYYSTGGNVTFYSVNLTASNSGGSDTRTKKNQIVVFPTCSWPVADFSYDGLVDLDENMVVEFTDLSSAYPEDIIYWDWDFGDDKQHYSGQTPPPHEYDAGNYTVKLTVTNDCGKSNTKSRPIVFPCTGLVGAIEAEPKTGQSPLTVNFTDYSTPHENITGWRWSFGDGTFYYTSNKTNPNPPPHTYDRVGTYYASLMVQNECGQAFVNTSVFVVSQPGSIGGRLWDDRNFNRALDGEESGLSGWSVDLEERRSGTWQVVNTTTTDASGYYLFNLEGVSNSVFRVREHLPADWRVTYSYGTYDQEVSDSILIYSTRDYSDVNFGNIGLHTSYIEIPGRFWMYGRPYYSDSWFYYRTLSDAAQYLDYNTTYNTNARTVPLTPIDGNPGRFITDPPGGYPLGYTSWGNSSFILTFREYNNYLKYVGQGAYFMDNWKLNGTVVHTGNHFPVPDNTIITADQLELLYKWDSTIHFDIDKPKEGEVIPYTPAYTVEAHFEGKGEQTTQCYLTSPVSSMKLFYNSTVGEYLVTSVDTRPYEGTKQLFTARMGLSTGGYIYTYSNATIAYEPITATITSITSEATSPNVKGIVTVIAQINGKWQDNTSAVLFVDGKPVVNMSLLTPGLPSTIQGLFNAEPYAGETIPIFVRVPYRTASVQDLMGPYADSPSQTIIALSKEPISANFTAYPWTGRAPHEMEFIDLSTGGANQWNWNFKDGETSTDQNPIHIFAEEGNYSVRLTVTNASSQSAFIEKNVTVSGLWHSANLLTSRFSTLAQGGMMSLINRGYNSSITVNAGSIPLEYGDYVQIGLRSPHSTAKIFIAGAITECLLADASVSVNGQLVAEGNITDIRIQDFENFHSNLTFTAAKSYYAWTSFQWDNLGVPVSWKRNLVIEDLMPTGERFMSLEINPAQSFFDGRAGQYSFT